MQRRLRGLLCRWPSITEWEMYITAQGPPPVSEMTYTVLSGTLNPSIPYHWVWKVNSQGHTSWKRLVCMSFQLITQNELKLSYCRDRISVGMDRTMLSLLSRFCFYCLLHITTKWAVQVTSWDYFVCMYVCLLVRLPWTGWADLTLAFQPQRILALTSLCYIFSEIGWDGTGGTREGSNRHT